MLGAAEWGGPWRGTPGEIPLHGKTAVRIKLRGAKRGLGREVFVLLGIFDGLHRSPPVDHEQTFGHRGSTFKTADDLPWLAKRSLGDLHEMGQDGFGVCLETWGLLGAGWGDTGGIRIFKIFSLN